MDLELRDRHALVTGSTTGIGFAIALGLAAEGAAVVLNGRKPDGVERALSASLTRRFAAPTEVANLAVFLCSPRAW